MLGGIWGQTRCSIYQSETSNVKRSTLNFQRSDRKGARWAGYGDRHGVLPVGGANRGTGTIFGPDNRTFDRPDLSKRRSDGSSRRGRPDMGTDTIFDIPIRNVQLSTFNGVTERAHGGRDIGTDTQFGRPNSWPGGPVQALVGRSKPAGVPRYGDRHGIWVTELLTGWT